MVTLLINLVSYFRASSQTDLPKHTNETLKSCSFCNVSIENGFNIVYEDDLFVAFQDKKPASQYHIQVIPKQHIASVRALRNSDKELVQSMEAIGHNILHGYKVPKTMRKMGFHIPPFNSVDHLHLHVQSLPYLTNRKAAKYPVASASNGNSKGFSWFCEVQQVIRILEQGKTVGVLPC